MTEKQLSFKIRNGGFTDRIRVYSFENCGQPSVPDLHCAGDGLHPFWLELKCVTTMEARIPFRDGQPRWMLDYPGACYVLVHVLENNNLFLFGPIKRMSLLPHESVRTFSKQQTTFHWVRKGSLGMGFLALESYLARAQAVE